MRDLQFRNTNNFKRHLPSGMVSKRKVLSSRQQQSKLTSVLACFKPPELDGYTARKQNEPVSKENKSSLLRKQALAKKLGTKDIFSQSERKDNQISMFRKNAEEKVAVEIGPIRTMNPVEQQKESGIAEAANFVPDADALQSILSNKGVTNNDVFGKKHVSLAVPSRTKMVGRKQGGVSLFGRQSLSVNDDDRLPQLLKEWKEAGERRLTLGYREETGLLPGNSNCRTEFRSSGVSKFKKQALTPRILLSGTKARLAGGMPHSRRFFDENLPPARKQLSYDLEDKTPVCSSQVAGKFQKLTIQSSTTLLKEEPKDSEQTIFQATSFCQNRGFHETAGKPQQPPTHPGMCSGKKEIRSESSPPNTDFSHYDSAKKNSHSTDRERIQTRRSSEIEALFAAMSPESLSAALKEAERRHRIICRVMEERNKKSGMKLAPISSPEVSVDPRLSTITEAIERDSMSPQRPSDKTRGQKEQLCGGRKSSSFDGLDRIEGKSETMENSFTKSTSISDFRRSGDLHSKVVGSATDKLDDYFFPDVVEGGKSGRSRRSAFSMYQKPVDNSFLSGESLQSNSSTFTFLCIPDEVKEESDCETPTAEKMGSPVVVKQLRGRSILAPPPVSLLKTPKARKPGKAEKRENEGPIVFDEDLVIVKPPFRTPLSMMNEAAVSKLRSKQFSRKGSTPIEHEISGSTSHPVDQSITDNLPSLDFGDCSSILPSNSNAGALHSEDLAKGNLDGHVGGPTVVRAALSPIPVRGRGKAKMGTSLVDTTLDKVCDREVEEYLSKLYGKHPRRSHETRPPNPVTVQLTSGSDQCFIPIV